MTQVFNAHDFEYHSALRDILSTGNRRGDRTGTGTISLFGLQMRFDLDLGFPLLTTKKVNFKSIVAELCWFLEGSTNAFTLRDKYGSSIWLDWADEDGELGPVYGEQWRNYTGLHRDLDPVSIDQIANVIDSISNNPESRRHIVTAWNPADVPDMALPPCHCLFQFYCEALTDEERHFVWERLFYRSKISADSTLESAKIPYYRLSCQLYQRSGDMFLGVPFNIASYALLTHMIANECNMIPGTFVHTLGDAHIYMNHIDQVEEQLKRESFEPPQIEIAHEQKSLFDITPQDIHLKNYQHHPAIKAPIAV